MIKRYGNQITIIFFVRREYVSLFPSDVTELKAEMQKSDLAPSSAECEVNILEKHRSFPKMANKGQFQHVSTPHSIPFQHVSDTFQSERHAKCSSITR